VLMLVSINKKTKTITLCSFMRDSRTYYEANGRGYWAKVNAAYSKGGAAATIETLEKDYKIGIDYYVAVDFTSFPKVIDALGGVTVDMKEYEQRYINRTTTAIKKIPNYGPVKLDGKQALVYARIRKCDADSDVSRTRRQRTLITAIIKSAKGASLTQLNNAIDTLLPLLATDCSKSQILSYGAQALAQGWLNYEIKQVTMPDEDTRKDARINGVSYWVVDYPLAAQRVQLALYGTTNIELDEYRDSALDYVKFNSNGSSNSSDSTESNAGNDNGVGYTEETTTRRGILDWWKPDSDDETTTGASEEIPSGDEPASGGEETTTAPVEQPSEAETTRRLDSLIDRFTTTQPAA
ncbi:MAG: LCP family protein, partial [Clostridia bacterium]|nr:LCP family protein [Clostridia bacterium]